MAIGLVQYDRRGAALCPNSRVSPVRCAINMGERVLGFLVRPNGSCMDTTGVMRGFDALMVALGRPDRAFSWLGMPVVGGYFGVFICAHGEVHPRVANAPEIPIDDEDLVKAYGGQA